jgi:hypothetical protein
MVINVQDMLATLQATLALFKNLTNFILVEFVELTTLVVLRIKTHVKSTNEHILHFFCLLQGWFDLYG